MEYTVTALAKQARVTVRALRHYDQIGLLKPSIRMANGKRIYGDEEFMRLAEIVYLKKIGIGLPKIKEIYRAKDSDKAVAAYLTARRQALAKEIKKLQRHVASIDIMLPQYKNCTLSHQERLEKFRSTMSLVKEVEEMQRKEFGKETVEEVKEKIDSLTDEEIEEVQERSFKLLKMAVKAVEQGVDPASDEAQALARQYYDLTAEFQPMTKEIFLKLMENGRDQRAYYDVYHPKLADFIYRSLEVFADRFFEK